MSVLDHRKPDLRSHGRDVRAAGTAARIDIRELSWSSLALQVPAWQGLAQRALEANVFYEPSFALAAAPLFGDGVRALTAWSGDGRQDMLGFLPLRSARWRYGLPLPVHVGWTHPFAPLGTPLVDRDRADAVLQAMLEHMAGQFVLLPLLPETGPVAAALAAALARTNFAEARFGSHERALLQPARNRADYLNRTIGGGKRKELRRQRRRLAEQGALRLLTCRERPCVAEALDAFLTLEGKGWKGRAGMAAALQPTVATFMRRAVTDLFARSQARIDRLVLDDRTLAAAITLRSGEAAWFWKIAYDEDFARHSPGVQLACDLTDALLAEPGVHRVDSCATADHPMINRLWRERLALSDRLIAAGKTAIPFPVVTALDSARRRATSLARSVRDTLRG